MCALLLYGARRQEGAHIGAPLHGFEQMFFVVLQFLDGFPNIVQGTDGKIGLLQVPGAAGGANSRSDTGSEDQDERNKLYKKAGQFL